MKRYAWLMCSVVLTLGLVACGGGETGDDDGMTPDAGAQPCDEVGGAICFTESLEGLGATKKESGGAANWNCPIETVMPSTMAITVSGVVEDFQSGDPIESPSVEAFDDLDFSSPVAMTTGGTDGAFSINLPSGMAKSRMNWRMKATGQLDTYALNEELDITQAAITGYDRGSVSVATANALPAFIGVIRTPGLGVLAGAAVDCDRDAVENVIATVSTTSSAGGGAPAHLDGAQVYYFSNGDPNLPVRRTSRIVTNKDGLFVIIEIPPTTGSTTYFLQAWGYRTDADAAMGEAGLSLLSEIQAPVVGDSVISVEMAPNQGP